MLQARWAALVAPKSKDILAMIMRVVDLLPATLADELTNYTSKHAQTICNNFPNQYGDEIV